MDYKTSILNLSSTEFSDRGATATELADDVASPTSTSQIPGVPNRAAMSTEALPDSIIGSWTKIAKANMTTGMYADLTRLASRPARWKGIGDTLRPDSLQKFLAFWILIRAEAVEPELALTPDGSVHAEWFKSVRQRLDVKFGERKLYFGLFNHNSIVEGAENVETVAQILKLHPSKPLLWSSQ